MKPMSKTVSHTVTLGVCGGTGSGKTTVARQILERVGVNRVAFLPHDAYYKPASHLPPEERSVPCQVRLVAPLRSFPRRHFSGSEQLPLPSGLFQSFSLVQEALYKLFFLLAIG